MSTCLANLRDLGGLPTVDGRATGSGVLYRADQPLPGDVYPTVSPWPPRTIIDLRSPHELRHQHPLETDTARVLSVPMFAAADPAELRESAQRGLPHLYEEMLATSGRQLAKVAEIVANDPIPVLLHCAAGKDGTGVAVAAVLAAAGVCDEAIIADYEATGPNRDLMNERLLRAQPEEEREAYRARLAGMPANVINPSREAIRGVLALIHGHRDGAGGWLIEHGLSPAHVDRLKARLVRATAATKAQKLVCGRD